MKTLIVYCSKSHGNTKKLVDAICAVHDDVDAVDATTLAKGEDPDFSQYLLIGLASGIYRGGVDQSVLRVAGRCLRDRDQVFGLLSYALPEQGYDVSLKEFVQIRRAQFLGSYGCRGYTDNAMMRPMRSNLVGHPDEEEIQGAVAFYDGLIADYGSYLVETREKRDQSDIYDAEHKPSLSTLAENLGDLVTGKRWGSRRQKH